MRVVPAPVVARYGFERAAFVFFLIGVGVGPAVGIANVALALCLAATIAWRLGAWRAGGDFLGPFRKRSPLHGPIGAFVLLSVFSCFFSTLPSRSIWELKGFGTFLLLPFAVALLRDVEDVHLVLDAWRITALYMILRGVTEYLSGSDNLDARLRGGMTTYMTYAGLLTLYSLALFSRGLSRAKGPASRAADLLVAGFGMVAVALTLTRSAYLGLTVGVVTLLLASRPRLVFAVPIVAGLFFLAMPAAVKERALSSFDPNDETMRDRLVMWRAATAMIADRPLFGVGPGRVKELYPVYRRPGFVDPRAGHLHDNVLMIAAETGIASALVYLGFLYAFFRNAWRRCRRYVRAPHLSIARGSLAALAAVTAAGLFEYNFGDVEVLMATLVLAALPFALPEEEMASIPS
ncbi:MAG TPA: O-antigen ligase family protein [Thermoanaerobaculia bacterium]|nr:O-antigen ligase family protein [Thermoanaerobaculia bacterium]